jgi:hypothetical protein
VLTDFSSMIDTTGLGFGFGWGDWLVLLLVLVLGPFLTIELILPTLGYRLFFGLFKIPWQKIAKQIGAIAGELYQIYNAFIVVRWVNRLLDDRKNKP